MIEILPNCRCPGYRWSSYRAHALGQADELIREHFCYLALGTTDKAKHASYKEFFYHQVDDASLKAIRDAVNSGTALGREQFRDEIEAVLTRSVRHGTPGRPKKIGQQKMTSGNIGFRPPFFP